MSGFTRAQSVGLIVSTIVVVIGIVIVTVDSLSGGASASFGWFAYQPLSGAVFSPSGAIIITPSMLLGLVLAALGLLGLAFVVGLRLGAKSATAK